MKTYYWLIWGIATILLITVKFLFRNFFTEDNSFILFTVYAIPMWLWIIFLNFRISNNLMNYLKMNYYEKWNELTYIKILGCNGNNSIAILKFLFSKDYLNDPQVKIYKRNYIDFLKFSIRVFFSFIPLFFLMVIF
jgi:purine-cytosine permease-like protein